MVAFVVFTTEAQRDLTAIHSAIILDADARRQHGDYRHSLGSNQA